MTSDLRETPPEEVRASWMTRLRAMGRPLLAALAAGVFLALVGAFGTIQQPLTFRLLYWVGLTLAGTMMAFGVSRAVCRVIDGETRPWLAGVVVALILAVLITGLVWLLHLMMFASPPQLGEVPSLFVQVLVITLAMTALITTVEAWPRRERSVGAREAASPVRFLDRLPPKLRRAELLAVEAQDHYLRVHTDAGAALVLLRLSDAIVELTGLEGARVHRSWWVSREAIESVKRGGGRTVLVLKGGLSAPVSRSYAPALRKDGWL